MASVNFTIYDPESGDIKCHGVCDASLVDKYVVDNPGCRALVGKRGSILEDRVIVPSTGSAPYLRRRSSADIEARRQAGQPKAIDPLAVVIEALKRKGIELSDADLADAAVTLQASRKDPVKAGK